MVDQLNPWFYKLKIGNGYTKPGIGTNYDEEFLSNRQKNRKKLIIDSWATREKVKNRTVLDIACNAGYWSYCLYKLGASKILGIEGRPLFIRQARLFYKANNVNCDYQFVKGNVVDLKTFNSIKPHDIVICAGILYHLPNWEEVLKTASNLTNEALIVDTRISKEDKYIQEFPDHFNAIPESSRKRIPTKRKLLKIIKNNFSEVKVVKPAFKDMKGLSGNDSYNQGKRLCIFSKKNG